MSVRTKVPSPRVPPRVSGTSRPPRAVLFSDVDGTLMDRRGRFATSRDMLARAAEVVDVVLASSRTLLELREVQAAMGITSALVAENGAIVAWPAGWRGIASPVRRRLQGQPWGVRVLGQRAAAIRAIARAAAESAGLDLEEPLDVRNAAGRPIGRSHSILVRHPARLNSAWRKWLGSLARAGLDATRSGDWITVTRGSDKGRGARALLALARDAGAQFAVTAAVGNAENDAPLLLAAGRRFVIRNPRRGHDASLVAVPKAHLLDATGIHGWREALDLVLSGLRRP